MRHLPSLVCLVCLGCQSFGTNEWAATSILRSAPLPQDEPLLARASEALERGDQAAACDLLRDYVALHPESKATRAFYAEVLAKLGKSAEAGAEFEKAIAQLQDDTAVDLAMIVHCHGRLLDLAEANGDMFHVHLHRGLGLYWLAQQKRTGAADDAIPTEAILCKAAMELAIAHSLIAEEARPSWYLHLAWRQLGQTAPAQRWLREAQAASPFTYLTHRERDDLMLRVSRGGT